MPKVRIYTQGDPFDSFKNEINRLVENFSSKIPEPNAPGKSKVYEFDTDIYESDNELIIEAEIPGVNKQDIKLSLSENKLTISTDRILDDVKKSYKFVSSEMVYGKYERVVDLPENVDKESITAKYENGILKINIAKIIPVDNSKTINID